jgi:hypothetical protein
MNVKLTVSLEDEVINKAKKYAKRNKTSLSKLIENYFRILVKDGEEKDVVITDKELLKMSGTIDLPDNVETDELLTEHLFKKYIHD